MAESHEWTLRRLREMAGRLTEQAYLRASQAAAERDDEAHARWMLVFDRMARGLRLSIALEARLSRERRWDAEDIARAASGERREAGQSGRAAAAREAEPIESDRESRDDDGLPHDAPLAERIGRLKSIIEGSGPGDPAPPRPRAARFRWAASPCPPDEPRDASTAIDPTAIDPTAIDRADHDAAPWRGSG